MRLLAACLAATTGSIGTATVTTTAHAQAYAPAFTRIYAGQVLDGTGGPPLKDVVISVKDGVIVAIQPRDAASKDDNNTIVDYSKKTILPGLISDHSHIGVVNGVSVAPENYNPQNIARQRHQYAAYGVTTVTALGNNYPLFYTVKRDAHRDIVIGADLFGAGEGIGVPGGMPPPSNGFDPVKRPETPEQAREAVRQMKQQGADIIKIWLDSGDGKFPKMKPEIYTAVIDEAHKNDLRVAAHVHDLVDAKTAVQAGVDILAHGVRDTAVDTEFINLLKERGTWYIPTLQLDEATFIYAEQPGWMKESFFQHSLQPQVKARFDDRDWREKTKKSKEADDARKSLAMNQKNIKTLFDAGVKIGFGTDSGAFPERIPGFAEHRELRLLVESGLTPMQALTIATGRAAELLKLSDRGTIAVGKRADFLVLDGDPSKRIENVDRIYSVWRGGMQISRKIDEFQP